MTPKKSPGQRMHEIEIEISYLDPVYRGLGRHDIAKVRPTGKQRDRFRELAKEHAKLLATIDPA